MCQISLCLDQQRCIIGEGSPPARPCQGAKVSQNVSWDFVYAPRGAGQMAGILRGSRGAPQDHGGAGNFRDTDIQASPHLGPGGLYQEVLGSIPR